MYYKYQIETRDILKLKICIKKAVDMQGNPYCLLSKAATVGRLLPNTEQLKEVRKRVGYFISESCTYRCDDMFYKYIEIIPYKGETLESLLLDEPEESEKEWAGELIRACLEQVAEKGIVHTDLKPANICVLDDVITIIDFDNAFIPELEHVSDGLGTPGYVAPELFKNIQDAAQQCEIYSRGDEHWITALKSDFRHLFTTATDIFALGQILLHDLDLEEDHPYYPLANRMSSIDPRARPNWSDIREIYNFSTNPIHPQDTDIIKQNRMTSA